jgi:hypothetical protein
MSVTVSVTGTRRRKTLSAGTKVHPTAVLVCECVCVCALQWIGGWCCAVLCSALLCSAVRCFSTAMLSNPTSIAHVPLRFLAVNGTFFSLLFANLPSFGPFTIIPDHQFSARGKCTSASTVGHFSLPPPHLSLSRYALSGSGIGRGKSWKHLGATSRQPLSKNRPPGNFQVATATPTPTPPLPPLSLSL